MVSGLKIATRNHSYTTYDVITEDDLDAEGVALLAHYRCVMTCTNMGAPTYLAWDSLPQGLIDPRIDHMEGTLAGQHAGGLFPTPLRHPSYRG